MGSLYPIVLSTLQGYSDDLLQWYFDQGSNEMHVNENQHITESDSTQSIDEEYSLKKTQIMDHHNNYGSYLKGMSNKGPMNTGSQKVSCVHQSSKIVQGEVNSTCSHENIRHYTVTETTESNSSAATDQCMPNRLRTKLVHNGSPSNACTDIDNFELTMSSGISDVTPGVLTMFELNPAAQKLLPNLVVGLKYRRWNSKVLELFINEDDSFVSLPK